VSTTGHKCPQQEIRYYNRTQESATGHKCLQRDTGVHNRAQSLQQDTRVYNGTHVFAIWHKCLQQDTSVHNRTQESTTGHKILHQDTMNVSLWIQASSHYNKSWVKSACTYQCAVKLNHTFFYQWLHASLAVVFIVTSATEGWGVYRENLGSPMRWWKDNIKIDLQEVGCGVWSWLRIDRWRTFVNAVINLRFP
jgi:hypothetical protein